MRNSIKAKIVVGLLLVICLAVGLVFSVTAYDISAYSRDTIVGFTAKQLQQVDRTVTQFLEEARFNAVMMSQNPTIADIDDSLTTYKHSTEPVKAYVRDDDLLGKQLSTFLRMIKDSHESYVEVYVGSRFGGFIESYPVSLPAGYDPTVRPWFKEASASPDQPIVSKAYMSTNGEATISVAKAAKVGNTVHAVVAMDIGLGVLTDMVKAIKLGRTGFVMMVQDDGVVIANPLDADTNFKNVADLEQAAYAHMFTAGQGEVSVTLNGVEYVGSVYTSPVTGWKYFGVVEKAEVMQSVYDVLKSMSVIFAVALLVIVLFVWFFVEYTTARPLRTVVDFLRGLAACNYEQQLQVRTQDEVGQIFASLNYTAEQLCDNMREISRKTEEAEDKARVAEAATQQARNALEQAERARAEGLLHAATQLEAVVAGISHATREMTSMTEGIRSGTEIQRERIQATATAMEEMNATVLEVAKNAGNAADQGNGVRDKAQEGAAIVGRSITAMNTTQKQAGALNEDMAKLDEQARAIGNIMTVISDIADQTNLLALNAAIEAARAGDAGRGFAVVADEVRKLAEKTMHATQEVGASIKSIQQVAADNVTAMTSAVKDLQQATDLANASGETLSGIVRGTEQSAGQIQSIATAAEEQSAASEEITRAIDEINGIALDTAESVDEASTALNELADQTRELVKLVDELKREGGRH